jgi:hypothetical protein
MSADEINFTGTSTISRLLCKHNINRGWYELCRYKDRGRNEENSILGLSSDTGKFYSLLHTNIDGSFCDLLFRCGGSELQNKNIQVSVEALLQREYKVRKIS